MEKYFTYNCEFYHKNVSNVGSNINPPSLIIIMLTLVRVSLIFNNSFSRLSSSSRDLNNSSTILGFYSTTNSRIDDFFYP
jgi:hypothetical protein